MNQISKIGLLSILLAAVVIVGCRRLQQFPKEPKIEFINFLQMGQDSAKLIVSFTDGDGDIGLFDYDTLPPYDYNLFLDYYERNNGEWELFDLPTPFYYRIPPLSDTDDGKALQGEIEVDLIFYYRPNGPDTIKYDIKLRDRELNESNIISTGPIAVPQ